MQRLIDVVFIAGLLVIAGCGGSGGDDDANNNPSGSNGDPIPSGKIFVDGHIFNPEFFTSGQDFYAQLTYFDTAGKLTSYHDVFEWQGQTATFSEDYRYSYNAMGRLASKEWEFTYTREGLALYTHSFWTTTYAYNLMDLVETETTVITGLDNDGDGDYDDSEFGVGFGSTTEIKTYSYDSLGKLTTLAIDDDGDALVTGSADITIAYEYDISGRLTKESRDIGNFWVTTLINEYDVNGRLGLQTKYPTIARFNTNEPESITDFSYNADGKLIEEAIDNGVAHSSNHTPDGTADTIIRYAYGSNGEPSEKSTEDIRISSSETSTIKYLHEVVDADADGTPESTVTYVFWLDPVFDTGGGYPAELLPSWYQTAQTSLNNNNNDDGWGVNWDGHGSNCSTCGNMIGEVTRIIYGF